MIRAHRLLFIAVAVVLFAPAQASATFYYEFLQADAQVLNPDTRIVLERDTQVANLWTLGNQEGAVITAGSGLGDGILTGSGPTQYQISYSHVLEPQTPGVVVDDIISAAVSIFIISDSAAAELAFVWLEGGEGTTTTGSAIPTYGFSMFSGDVEGVISVTDGVVNVRAYGSTQFRIVASALSVEYTPGVGGVSTGGGGQPSIPEPHAAVIFPIGILLGGLAARRARASRTE
jgi:hypothetical protein